MRRRLMTRPLAVAAALAMAGLAACSASAPAAGPADAAGAAAGAGATIALLRVGDDGTVSALNAGQDAGDNIYGALEDLLKFGPRGQVEPSLATSVSQASPVTYTYHLRRGVRFWDGSPMTSADVVSSLNYYRQPGLYTASVFAPVKSITAADPNTVVVTLKNPYAPWGAQLAGAGPIFEKKFQDEHKATMGHPGVLIMGTGPFRLDSFDPTSGLQLSANPHWWGGKVPVQHVSVKYFASETSEALAFRAGEIDVAFPLNANAFSSTSGAKLTSAPAFAEGYFGMNYHLPPWNDVHVRRAVAYALNRTDIIKALGNTAIPVSTLIPASQLRQLGTQAAVSAVVKSLPSYPYSLTRARAELAQSAYPHGFTATTQTISFAAYTPVDEVIAAELQKIGINLKLKTIGFDQFLALADGPKSAVGGLYATFNLSSADPSSYPAFILGSNNVPKGGYNWANYDPPAVDALIKAGVTTEDPAKRLAVYTKMLQILAADEPYVPLYNEDYNVALSGKFTWPGFNVYTQQADWELNVKQK
jgi:peptide/nickel transport system substrate-binding protein